MSAPSDRLSERAAYERMRIALSTAWRRPTKDVVTTENVDSYFDRILSQEIKK